VLAPVSRLSPFGAGWGSTPRLRRRMPSRQLPLISGEFQSVAP